MSLKTRLDGRSENNNELKFIKSDTGEVIASVKLLDENSSNLVVSTSEGIHIAKNNGWSSKR